MNQGNEAPDGRNSSTRILPYADHSSVSIADQSLQRDLDESVLDTVQEDGENAKNTRGEPNSARALLHQISVPPAPREGGNSGRDETSVDPSRNDRFEPSETTALLGNDGQVAQNGITTGEGYSANTDLNWEEAILAGKIQTSWQREAQVVTKFSTPLVLTFVLEYSLTMTSIFAAGYLGKIELGAVSIGAMTANITGYTPYYGLSTSLDTLCAQAFGGGNKKLVGLQMQRMVYFLWACTIPIGAVWLLSTEILLLIIPEREIVLLAGLYLKILVLGAPGFALFEAAKRYVQAQGRFSATTYVLLIAAPLNILMHWLFVLRFNWGFIGCPIAIVITDNLMPLLLFLYVRVIGGMECWPGFSRSAFKNWSAMIRLAIPGFLMTFAGVLAFEILTLAAARLSADHLAAQTILQTLNLLAYHLPYPVGIAVSTRIANLVGAGLPNAAKKTAIVSCVIGTVLGLFNLVILASLRNRLPFLFSSDPDVVRLTAATLPINAAFQLPDAIQAQTAGILRGLGRQEIGGYICLIAYYAVAIPISFAAAFGLHWDLYGLWAGPAIALVIIVFVMAAFIFRINWDRSSEEAAMRNAAG